MSEIFPLITDLGAGSLTGFLIGYSIKKLFRILAIFAGAYLLSLYALASKGIISFHIDATESLVTGVLSKISQFGMNLGATGLGFTGGLYLGLKKG